MSFVLNLFRRREPEDFEQVLSRLADDIQKRQTHLSELRLRERRVLLQATVYTCAFWVAYVSVWYATPSFLPALAGQGHSEGVEKVVKTIPVVIGPIVILFLRRIVQIGYGRIGSGEEKTLQELRKQQREKIEEFKKKTNYYKTRNLLERFDSAPTPRKPLQSANQTPQPPGGLPRANLGPVTPTRGGKKVPSPLQTPPRGGMPGMPPQLSATPMPTPRKQWFDKLADAILGDDEDGASASIGSVNRYALICQKCFAHNGLVKESMWEDAQYVCPKCGHFNPSVRSMKSAGAGVSPTSPQAASGLPGTARANGGARAPRSSLGSALGPPIGLSAPVETSGKRSVSDPSRKRSVSPNTDDAQSPDASMDLDEDY